MVKHTGQSVGSTVFFLPGDLPRGALCPAVVWSVCVLGRLHIHQSGTSLSFTEPLTSWAPFLGLPYCFGGVHFLEAS